MTFSGKTRLVRSFITVLMLCQLTAQAQDNYYVEAEHKFYGGLVAGGNFAQVDGDYIAGYHKLGLNAGAIVYMPLRTHLAASLEILYSQKGSKSKDPVTLPSGVSMAKYGMKLNYAEVPVMINYFDKRKTNFGIGLSIAELASSSEYISTYPAQTFDLTKYPFKKTDLNFITGCNLHLWQGLYFNIRFQYSLLSIRDYIPQSTDKTAQFNNLWVLRLMYLFT